MPEVEEVCFAWSSEAPTEHPYAAVISSYAPEGVQIRGCFEGLPPPVAETVDVIGCGLYLKETPADEQAGDLLAAQIRIRTESGRFRNLSLHEATATQIDEAAALLRASKKGGQRIGRAMRKRLEQLAEALPAAPTGTRAGRRVRATRGRDGRVALTFQAIPADELVAFAAAIVAHARKGDGGDGQG